MLHQRRWSRRRAWDWHRRQPWLVGCNFVPSTACNQLEMWQAETFDPGTIARELGWARDLGFNTVRVFLHHLPWQHDAAGYLERIDRFLEMAAARGIVTMLVLLDGVWDPHPRPGRQPPPRPGVHNSRWVQSPGAEILGDPARHQELRDYVVGVVGRFGSDPRVLAWDLFNEPDNDNPAYADAELPNKAEMTLLLLDRVFRWARSARPQQPLTAGLWRGEWGDPRRLSPLDRLMLEESDIVSFHCYGPPHEVRRRLEDLERYGRPLLLTEFMARPLGSTFEGVLPLLKERKVGAYCWGLVAGRTQTFYPWDSWTRPYEGEPSVWFHDVLRPDGTPYRSEEAEFLRRITAS
ncbi:MAG TPA: cellulase family glycosylhydrolase [Dehalococcoidia bacterium]|nr:cellulase family glycosylhydrolase [Dehalococcoidia bacterium]